MEPNVFAPATGVPDRRRSADRRQRTLRALLYGSIRPRRRGPRRSSGAAGVLAVDGIEPRWIAVGALIVALSGLDGLLTLRLLELGAYEANPVMAALLAQDSLWPFVAVKTGLTVGGVAMLTAGARLAVFGGLRVSSILGAVLGLYATLVLYEIGLLRLLAAPP